MGKRWKVMPPGTFEGKKITFADTDQVESYPEIAAHFMSAIYELDVGNYLITDESHILDFSSVAGPGADGVWQRVQSVYGITESDVGSGLLVKIFEILARRRTPQ